MSDEVNELAALRAALAAQQVEIEELKARLDSDPPARVAASPSFSRRALLGLAGTGAVGAIVGAGATPVGAADGDPLLLGQDNESTSETVLTKVDGPDGSGGPTLRVVAGEAPGSTAISVEMSGQVARGIDVMGETTGAGVLARTTGPQSRGIYGWADYVGVLGLVTEGSAVEGADEIGAAVLGGARGPGRVGGAFLSDDAPQLYLTRTGTEEGAVVGPPAGDVDRGMVFADDAGDLWFCTAPGDPGVWTRLNHQTSVHLEVPQRAFDSRSDGGRFGSGETRVVDLSVGTALDVKARSAVVTVTVTGTTSSGYVSVAAAGVDLGDPPGFVSASWSGAGETVSATLPVVTAAGSVQVYVHRAAHVVVDLVGWQDSRPPEVPMALPGRRVEGGRSWSDPVARASFLGAALSPRP